MITYFAVWNLIVFLVYGLDKLKAIRGGFRISENTLIFLAYFFGGFGAFFGMYIFRHKTRKWKFKILVPLALVCNIVIIYYLDIK